MDKTKMLFYRINEVYFKLNETAQPNVKYQILPKFECKLNSGKENYNVILTVRINADISRSQTPFDLNITIVGAFSVGEDCANDKQKQASFALQSLFPFLRSFVATLTVNCNLPACFLPLPDIEAMVGGVNLDTSNKNSTDLN